jgi:hypothetical protein
MTPTNTLDRIGLPRHLAWGYLGIMIFMMGDGVEQGWLSPYLLDRGMTIQQSASSIHRLRQLPSPFRRGSRACWPKGYGPK